MTYLRHLNARPCPGIKETDRGSERERGWEGGGVARGSDRREIRVLLSPYKAARGENGFAILREDRQYRGGGGESPAVSSSGCRCPGRASSPLAIILPTVLRSPRMNAAEVFLFFSGREEMCLLSIYLLSKPLPIQRSMENPINQTRRRTNESFLAILNGKTPETRNKPQVTLLIPLRYLWVSYIPEGTTLQVL